MEFDKIIMLIIAILLDLFGLLFFILSFFGVGIAISFLPDVIGGLTIGLWSLLKKGGTAGIQKGVMKKGGTAGIQKGVMKKGGTAGIQKGVMKKALKYGIAQITELIPFLGDISPSWTILVLTS